MSVCSASKYSQRSITPRLHVTLQNYHYVELHQHYGNDLGSLSAIKHSVSGVCGVIS